jgi:hypothetical protein
MSWFDCVMQHLEWLYDVTICNEVHIYGSFDEIYCLHIHESNATGQSTNQTNKQTKLINCKGNQPVQSPPIYNHYLGIHMTKVFFSKGSLPDWSLLLPAVITNVAKHIRISTFPSYFRHYCFYILAMCLIFNKVWWFGWFVIWLILLCRIYRQNVPPKPQ